MWISERISLLFLAAWDDTHTEVQAKRGVHPPPVSGVSGIVLLAAGDRKFAPGDPNIVSSTHPWLSCYPMTPEKPCWVCAKPWSRNQRFSNQIQGLPENSTWNIMKPIILGNEMPNKYMKTCENKFCTGFRNVPDIFSINQKRKYSRTHVDHKPPPSSYELQWWLDPVGYWSCWSSIRHLCLKPLGP